ncbi:hypothetical protein J6W32_04285 [bacterium]|nr:hypothetical protein [bacterium]
MRRKLGGIEKEKMTNQQKDLYERTLIDLRNILNSLSKKQCSDKDYMYLCKKLKQIYQKLNQNYPKLNNNYKNSPKREKHVSINDYIADG